MVAHTHEYFVLSQGSEAAVQFHPSCSIGSHRPILFTVRDFTLYSCHRALAKA